MKFFHWTLDIVKRFKTYTIFPHIVFAETILFEFGNPKVTVHKCAETIQGRKLLKGGNYMRKYGIQTVNSSWRFFLLII